MTPPEPTDPAISLFLDIGQGAGLAGASGIRPFLPPLLAGALARGDVGLDFDGTAYGFLERPPFLLAVLVAAALWYAVSRARAGRQPEGASPGGTQASGAGAPELAAGALAVVLGGLLFAGSLAGEGHTGWPGLVAGALCAALAYAATSALLTRVRRRLDTDTAALLPAYADGLALGLAILAILAPPVSFLALVLLAVLLLRTRRTEGRKFEGLRILR